MAPANEFSRRIRKRSQEINWGANDVVKRAALAIDKAVIFATPVDTGRARSNWRAALGGPFTKQLDETSATGAIGQAESVINGRGPGQTIYISNNVPYIRRLNEGWSAQAPAGFVEDAMLIGRRIVREAKLFK
jgi:hypothetical protein